MKLHEVFKAQGRREMEKKFNPSRLDELLKMVERRTAGNYAFDHLARI